MFCNLLLGYLPLIEIRLEQKMNVWNKGSSLLMTNIL